MRRDNSFKKSAAYSSTKLQKQRTREHPPPCVHARKRCWRVSSTYICTPRYVCEQRQETRRFIGIPHSNSRPAPAMKKHIPNRCLAAWRFQSGCIHFLRSPAGMAIWQAASSAPQILHSVMQSRSVRRPSASLPNAQAPYPSARVSTVTNTLIGMPCASTVSYFFAGSLFGAPCPHCPSWLQPHEDEPYNGMYQGGATQNPD